MTIDDFIRVNHCDKLYHMSEKGSWPHIVELGLLSTSALLDSCGYTGNKRFEIESQIRKSRKPVTHPTRGTLYIRDQVPMIDNPERGRLLDELLDDDVTQQAWFEFLNKKVFFWVNLDELVKMLCAWQYSGRPQWVITIDTKSLLLEYYDKAYVTDQNTGSLYSGKKRGPRSFEPLSNCRVKSNIKELVIDYHVPNLCNFAISVDEYTGEKRNGERVCRLGKHIWP